MNTFVRMLLVISTNLTLARADDEMLPPKDLRAEWTELQELKFSNWGIKSFLGWDVPFDGGSKVFFFESEGGERFDLVVANPGYWTAQDKKESCQVFLVRHKNRFYRIEPKSDEEKNMIEKLTDAARKLSGEGKKDSKLLTSLAERLESREPIFKPKG
ncbi:MAG: hypothetical protein V4640_00950 [Verrucomicrobiota bacterium]